MPLIQDTIAKKDKEMDSKLMSKEDEVRNLYEEKVLSVCFLVFFYCEKDSRTSSSAYRFKVEAGPFCTILVNSNVDSLRQLDKSGNGHYVLFFLFIYLSYNVFF